ncbi:hypothetical protein [Kitasatospora cineracea]|uniref:hypothetical protein n=1 Tax=Kitasatospora cineracea TaxID=88074 RepID=UPI0036C08D23
MTALRIFAAGLAHVAQPGPYLGYGWQVRQELDARDTAAIRLAAARYGTREWLDAQAARVGAECRLARLLDVTPPPVQQLVLDDPWLTGLYDQLTA